MCVRERERRTESILIIFSYTIVDEYKYLEIICNLKTFDVDKNETELTYNLLTICIGY